MKKIFAIMVSAILIVCILSGCGSPNVSDPSNENTLHVATSVAELSMEALVNHADIIVAGKVSDSSEYVMSADSTYKTSTVSIDVSDVYKGGILAGDSVTVEINTYLGVNGVIAEHEPLPPTFSSNDSVLLFLVANDHGSYYIAGVNQGAYFKSVTKSTDAIQYERQNRLGFGPETFMLADMLEYIENCATTGTMTDGKPILYLYPEKETTVMVTLDYDGTLPASYPAYGEGWTVTARPDGTLPAFQRTGFTAVEWGGCQVS